MLNIDMYCTNFYRPVPLHPELLREQLEFPPRCCRCPSLLIPSRPRHHALSPDGLAPPPRCCPTGDATPLSKPDNRGPYVKPTNTRDAAPPSEMREGSPPTSRPAQGAPLCPLSEGRAPSAKPKAQDTPPRPAILRVEPPLPSGPHRPALRIRGPDPSAKPTNTVDTEIPPSPRNETPPPSPPP